MGQSQGYHPFLAPINPCCRYINLSSLLLLDIKELAWALYFFQGGGGVGRLLPFNPPPLHQFDSIYVFMFSLPVSYQYAFNIFRFAEYKLLQNYPMRSFMVVSTYRYCDNLTLPYPSQISEMFSANTKVTYLARSKQIILYCVSDTPYELLLLFS